MSALLGVIFVAAIVGLRAMWIVRALKRSGRFQLLEKGAGSPVIAVALLVLPLAAWYGGAVLAMPLPSRLGFMLVATAPALYVMWRGRQERATESTTTQNAFVAAPVAAPAPPPVAAPVAAPFAAPAPPPPVAAPVDAPAQPLVAPPPLPPAAPATAGPAEFQPLFTIQVWQLGVLGLGFLVAAAHFAAGVPF